MKTQYLPELLTPVEVADLLGHNITRRTVLNEVRRGNLGAVHVGRRILIPRESLVEYLTPVNAGGVS